MKKCSGCLETKPTSEFYTRKDSVDGLRGACKVCDRLRAKSVKPEVLSARFEYQKSWRAEHKEQVIISARTAGKKWRDSNKEHNSTRSRKYRQENKERFAHYSALRRYMSANAEGTFSLQEWIDLCDEYRNRCLRCLQNKPLTRDHVIPLSKGGSNWITNIQPLCKECNSAKGTKSTDYRCLY